jgi:hypothetical protein
MTLESRPGAAQVTERHESRWSTVAIVAALLVWVGGLFLHVVGVLGPVVAVAGAIAGAVAIAREGMRARRVAAAVATVASVAGLAVYVLVLTSAIGWPPIAW